jgi:RNA polymerase II-associated factor 1
MTSSKEFGQDYLARVRYRNDLPPPPGAPKLLEVPHDGLGRFLRPGYASRLVREQPLNIDVDAEGGMPIDMVGIPGYFFGDESGMFD